MTEYFKIIIRTKTSLSQEQKNTFMEIIKKFQDLDISVTESTEAYYDKWILKYIKPEQVTGLINNLIKEKIIESVEDICFGSLNKVEEVLDTKSFRKNILTTIILNEHRERGKAKDIADVKANHIIYLDSEGKMSHVPLQNKDKTIK